MPNKLQTSVSNRNNNQDTTRGMLSEDATILETRINNEKQVAEITKQIAEKYFRDRKDIEDQLLKLRKADAQELNNFTQNLEEKFASIKKKYNLSDAEVQKRVARQVADYNRQLQLQTAQKNLSIQMKDLSLLKKEQQKNNKSLSKEIKAEKDKSRKEELKNQLKEEKTKQKELQKEQKKQIKEARKEIMANASSKQEGYQARLEANKYDAGAQVMTKLNENINNLVNNFKNMFQSTIEKYGEYQSKVNVRLQGLETSWQGVFGYLGIEENLTSAIGVNPLVKLEDVFDNVVKATEQGITFNIEQRAFLETIKDEIAATFDAFNANLTRIIRLQQEDSTAARLGLESALTQFFNANYTDSSYLSSVSDAVSSSLTEAIAQMGTKQGVEFEYQVQKWLGSLYSVGLSESTVTNIASALGMLGSGDVSGLAGNQQMQNLIVMAASRVGLSYADMLTEGLNVSDTNKLLASMVNYLQEIAESDNKVVKSQYAQVFGLTTSDLVAAKNLRGMVSDISKSSLSYGNAVDEVFNQMNQLYSRLSISQMLANAKDNMIYSIGSNIASNPITYAIWEITSMIEDLTGGIAIPTIGIMGNSIDLETTITNLMRTGIVGISTLGAIGDIISGIGSTVAPSSMLTKLGINNSDLKKVTRGTGLTRGGIKLSGAISSSNMVGNSAGSDYADEALTQANADAENEADIKRQESTDMNINAIHEYLLSVFDPKITDIERMVASLAGVNLTEGTRWGDFTSTHGKNNYYATSISIKNENELQMNKNNMDNINSIKNDVSAILTLLNSVVSGEYTLKVYQTNTNISDVIGGGGIS